jgi:hypothetical protein
LSIRHSDYFVQSQNGSGQNREFRIVYAFGVAPLGNN